MRERSGEGKGEEEHRLVNLLVHLEDDICFVYKWRFGHWNVCAALAENTSFVPSTFMAVHNRM